MTTKPNFHTERIKSLAAQRPDSETLRTWAAKPSLTYEEYTQALALAKDAGLAIPQDWYNPPEP